MWRLPGFSDIELYFTYDPSFPPLRVKGQRSYESGQYELMVSQRLFELEENEWLKNKCPLSVVGRGFHRVSSGHEVGANIEEVGTNIGQVASNTDEVPSNILANVPSARELATNNNEVTSHTPGLVPVTREVTGHSGPQSTSLEEAEFRTFEWPLRDLRQKFSSSNKYLVIIYSWLFPKEKHLKKYRDMYRDKGIDVMIVRTKPKHVLCPPFGTKVQAKRLYSILSILVPEKYSKVIVHSFSVGNYVFGELALYLMKMANKPEEARSARKIIGAVKGFISDSTTSSRKAHNSLTWALSDGQSSLIMPLVGWVFQVFTYVTYPMTYKNFKKVEDMYVEKFPFDCPMILLASANDKACDLKILERAFERNTSRGIRVRYVLWANSIHVSHLAIHPARYRSEVFNLIKFIENEENYFSGRSLF